MVPRILRNRLLLTLVTAQLVFLAAGFWIHHRLVVWAVRRAAEGLEAGATEAASEALEAACRLWGIRTVRLDGDEDLLRFYDEVRR